MKTEEQILEELTALLYPAMSSERQAASKAVEILGYIRKEFVADLPLTELSDLLLMFMPNRKKGKKSKTKETTAYQLVRENSLNWDSVIDTAVAAHASCSRVLLRQLNEELASLLTDKQHMDRMADKYGDVRSSTRLNKRIDEIERLKENIFHRHPELDTEVASDDSEDPGY